MSRSKNLKGNIITKTMLKNKAQKKCVIKIKVKTWNGSQSTEIGKKDMKSNILKIEYELLRTSVEDLKAIVVSNKLIIKSLQNQFKAFENQFKCNFFDYEASIITGLKSHMIKNINMKHWGQASIKFPGQCPPVKKERYEE